MAEWGAGGGGGKGICCAAEKHRGSREAEDEAKSVRWLTDETLAGGSETGTQAGGPHSQWNAFTVL